MTDTFLSKEGEKYENFSLINCQYIEELELTLRELIHLPTGAQVMHLENDDPENVFCLSFKTLPNNSNGAPHILEHTVLCGSRKYPIKDPFFSMSRRSLNTYMNALTGADFTCYPAASQVEKDFYNLLEVYIDAVFHPLLKEESFLQEGHRLEFAKPQDPTSPLIYKGIVYNEMKGALSSVDSRIWHAMSKALVPDLTYAHNSGGDPKEIPNLSYAELIDFHETFYHPSRTLFYFYGNFPLKKHLDFIEEKALKNSVKLPPVDGIGHQSRFSKPKKEEHTYPTSETEELEEKHIVAFGWLTAALLNLEDVLALIVLDSVLMDTDASPLKKILLDSELCVHADCYLDVEMTEIPLIMVLRECQKDDADAIEAILFDALRKIASDGIPYPLVEAAIHQLEFARQEIGGGSSPFGLTLFMRSALAKQHGCAPEHSLRVHSLFKSLREKAKDPHFFTPLIEKYLINNPHFVRLQFAPDPTLSAKEEQEEAKRLKQVRASLNEKEVAHILTQTKHLEEFQEMQEGQKLECLPKVTLADIPAEARHFDLDNEPRKGWNIYHHEVFTNKILYADLVFDLPDLTEEELFYMQMLLIFWPELGCGKRSFEENLEYTHAHTGGVTPHFSLHVQADDPTKSRPSLQLHGKALKRKMGHLFSLFEDMLTAPRFDEAKRIEELLKKLFSSMQSRLPQMAMRYASQLALSGFSLPSHINQKIHGLDFYTAVQKLARNPKQGAKTLMERFQALKEKILCIGTPELVISGEKPLYQSLDKEGFYNIFNLPQKTGAPWKGNYPLQAVPNQGRIISSPVAFTVEGFKTVHYTHPDAPALTAATILLENKILHHRIREIGGAYGAGATYNPMWGNFYLYAYRDPHIAHTLHTFRDSIHELTDGNFTGQDLEEAKMGIIQGADTPTPPGSRALVSYTWLREGKTRQMRQNYRDKLLSLSANDIQKAVETHLLSQVNEGTIITFAGKELLEKELPNIKDKNLEVFPI